MLVNHADYIFSSKIKALSKKHACIEVQRDLHLIYDCGSKNRTKKGKVRVKSAYEQRAHQAETDPSFCCTKLLGINLFLLSPGWDASLSQGTPSSLKWYLLVHVHVCSPGWREVLGV